NGSTAPQSAPVTGRDKWTGRYPHLGTGPLAADVFTSPEQFELERERIFKKVWLNVGRVEQIPNAGDFFVKDIEICQTSILVVRGADGQVRAFHNMCSHRGNKVCWDKAGNKPNFTCKFHGWVYGHEGDLKYVPDEEHFFDFKRDDHGMA
ncbi:MAG: Rieske 2Fe-2S domain-containing protein, partial [Akkermansiaceae bacterium]|nr:Rieske 2Fe-2S domain-containing protein [Akkermansiaceae bacterium]